MISGCESDSEFQCDNGNCIALDNVNDGDDNCGDSSDESKQIIIYKLNVRIYLEKTSS